MIPTVRGVTLLELIAEGKSNKQIADVLGISQNTVRNELILLFARCGALNRTHAVAIAFQEGWLPSGKQV